MDSWHSRELEGLMKELDSGPGGLSSSQAARRLKEVGPNALAPPEGRPLLRRVGEQLADPMVVVLLGAAALSLGVSGGREWLDGAIILLIVVVNCLISISQEDKAHRALEELGRMAAPRARVLRDGGRITLPAEQLVPGDVVILEAGDQVPADCRLVECSRLQVEESAMTGESLPAQKEVCPPLPPDTPLGDRKNMVLAGTMVTGGRCTALVCATGMDTQMGRIAGLLTQGEAPPTPLQEKMGEISRTLSFLCLCLCALMFGVGLLQGRELLPMLLTAVSLGVAAIPEGLPAIVTIVLALGVGRMAKRGAIVKKLPAVETLGCAGVICSDKTGTLTQNRMEVQRLWLAPGAVEGDALLCAALCGDGELTWRGGAPQVAGDPTEGALISYAARRGLDRNLLGEQWPRVGDIPFDSKRKRMTTVHRRPDGGYRVLVKGAPEVLLPRCRSVPAGEMTPTRRRAALGMNQQLAEGALRVLGVAWKDISTLSSTFGDELEVGLTFLGLFGMMDPPRPEVAQAVERCRRAGIRPVMITGDHRATALAIARELDICRPGELAITGGELDFMPQQVLEQDIEAFSVFARVTPEHKIRIVRAWQKRGMVVAMTGDGVNDAPALKGADIGCAMGRSGTDVAKGAAHMILTDDNFSTIVRAVEEGRGIWANIRKAIHYLLSCNIGEVFTIFGATLLGLGQMPLLPVQLLWLNLVTDSFPALALGVEPVEPGVMDRPPRDGREGLFDSRFTLTLAWQGLMVGGLTLGAYFMGLDRLAAPGLEEQTANTMAFATLTLCQLFHAFNVRSPERSLFDLGVLSNPAMVRAFLLGLGLELGVLLLPPVRAVFGVAAMTGRQWVTVLALAVAPIPICEGAKGLARGRERAAPRKKGRTPCVK